MMRTAPPLQRMRAPSAPAARRAMRTARGAVLALLSALLLGAGLPGAGLQSAHAAQGRAAKEAKTRDFSFAIIGHTASNDTGDEDLKRAIAEANRSEPAFVLSTGIKSYEEACSDRLYTERRDMMNTSERPLVLLLAGSDWTDCRSSNGRSNAIERLNRIRELYFSDNESLGMKHIMVSRQSSIPKFRSYAEHMHWEQDKILFATINLPAKNNHFRMEAGRNSEYEDRMVANRAWLQRLFTWAKRRKLEAVVLVSDGEIGAHIEQGFFSRLAAKKDGFTETRRIVRGLAEKFPGKVLLIDSQKPAEGKAPSIQWTGNIGHVGLAAEWAEIRVAPGSATVFTLATP